MPAEAPDHWETSYYLYDGLGTVRALADTDSLVSDAYCYDAWGNLINVIGTTPNAYLYTGEQYDADLGMYFLRARYLNPETGRFHTLDTYEGRMQDPQTLHKYLYANANPVMGIDPSGETAIGTLVASTISNFLDKSIKPITAQVGRRTAKKVACEVIEYIVEEAIQEGVYILFAEGIPIYVGQSQSTTGRVQDHLNQNSHLKEVIRKYGDKIDKYVKMFPLPDMDKTAREIFEQQLIDHLGGKDSLENKRNPVGNARKKRLKKAKKWFNIEFCK